MGFFANLFKKANEIDRLASQCADLQSRLDREIWRNEKLEAQVIAERKSKDKFVMTAMDQISVKNGLYATFAKSVEKKQKPEPEVFSPEREEQIRWAANEMRNADMDDPLLEPKPIEVYIEAIKLDVDKYLPA